jgi:Fur family zinc uptake transcriptional regulator
MPRKLILQDFIQKKHNHSLCVEEALARAEAVCAERNERFTALRRIVLELVWSQHKPIKAYDLLAQLAEHHERPAPPTVYRALDFLREAGLVHKIQSLNAYVGCGQPERAHQGQFLICEGCGTIAELEDENVTSRIDQNAKKVGFKISSGTIEVNGLCRQCQ